MIKKGHEFKGGYRVQFVLNEGDYARNYRVYDSEDNLKVLKLIDFRKLNEKQLDNSGNVIEEEVLKLINHENIVKFHDSGIEIIESVKYFYLVTDFISGVTLNKYVETNDFNKYEIKEIVKDILDALNYLHSFDDPIVHNELNLTNVFYEVGSSDNRVKLIDFGHSLRLSNSFSNLSIEGSNPFYVAPELVNSLFSIQSDIFSVGAIYYTLLTGLPPWFISISEYKAGNVDSMNLINAQRQKPLVRPNSIDDHTYEILRKALAFDARKRFANAQEFLHAIENKDSQYLDAVLDKKDVNYEYSVNKIKSDGGGFNDVAGLELLKQSIKDDVIDVLKDPVGAKEYGISLPNGILLWGPPGCGKTYFVEKFSEEVGYNFISVKPSDLGSIYVHGGQGKIKELFDSARENAPSIIFFDELDALVPNRSGGINQSISGEVNEFLTQMSNCSDDGIFVIGATNRPDMIDSAVKRAGRIDKKFYIPRPDKGVRASLFKLHLSKRPLDVGINYNDISERTDYYVASDIALICNEAAKNAKKANAKISNKILLSVIDKIQPSVLRSELIKYENLKLELDSEGVIKNDDSPRRSIGFKRN